MTFYMNILWHFLCRSLWAEEKRWWWRVPMGLSSHLILKSIKIQKQLYLECSFIKTTIPTNPNQTLHSCHVRGWILLDSLGIYKGSYSSNMTTTPTPSLFTPTPHGPLTVVLLPTEEDNPLPVVCPSKTAHECYK